jgi:hypothetical protein
MMQFLVPAAITLIAALLAFNVNLALAPQKVKKDQ